MFRLLWRGGPRGRHPHRRRTACLPARRAPRRRGSRRSSGRRRAAAARRRAPRWRASSPGRPSSRSSDPSRRARSGPPSPRQKHGAAVWAGSRLIVWGGYAGGPMLGDEAIYDPGTDTRGRRPRSRMRRRPGTSTPWSGRASRRSSGATRSRSGASSATAVATRRDVRRLGRVAPHVPLTKPAGHMPYRVGSFAKPSHSQRYAYGSEQVASSMLPSITMRTQCCPLRLSGWFTCHGAPVGGG